jgi:hypothetical protein
MYVAILMYRRCGAIVYRLDQYVPDSLYDSYESVRDTMISYLIKFGLIGGKARAAGTGSEAARECLLQGTIPG